MLSVFLAPLLMAPVVAHYIRWALERTRGNKSQAARLLRLSHTTLADHMSRLDITSDPYQ